MLKILMGFAFVSTTIKASHFEHNLYLTTPDQQFYHSNNAHIRILPGGKPFLAIPNPAYTYENQPSYFYLVGPGKNLAYPFILLDLNLSPLGQAINWQTCLTIYQRLDLIFAFSDRSSMEVYFPQTFHSLPAWKKASFIRVESLFIFPSSLQTIQLQWADTPQVVTPSYACYSYHTAHGLLPTPAQPGYVPAPQNLSSSVITTELPPKTTLSQSVTPPSSSTGIRAFSRSNTPPSLSPLVLAAQLEQHEDPASPVKDDLISLAESTIPQNENKNTLTEQPGASKKNSRKRNKPKQNAVSADELALSAAIAQATSERAALEKTQQQEALQRQKEERDHILQKLQEAREKKAEELCRKAHNPKTTAAEKQVLFTQLKQLVPYLPDSLTTLEIKLAVHIYFEEKITPAFIAHVQEKLGYFAPKDPDAKCKGRICYFVAKNLLQNLTPQTPKRALAEIQEEASFWLYKGTAYGQKECLNCLLPTFHEGEEFDEQWNDQLSAIEECIGEEIEKGIKYLKISQNPRLHKDEQLRFAQIAGGFFTGAKDACTVFPNNLQTLLSRLEIAFYAQDPLDGLIAQVLQIINNQHSSITADNEEKGNACHRLYSYFMKTGQFEDAMNIIKVGKELGSKECIRQSIFNERKNADFCYFPEGQNREYYDKQALEHLEWARQEDVLRDYLTRHNLRDEQTCHIAACFDRYIAHLNLVIRCCEKGNPSPHNRALTVIAQLKRGDIFTKEHLEILQGLQALEPLATFSVELLDTMKSDIAKLLQEQKPEIGMAINLFTFGNHGQKTIEKMRTEFASWNSRLESYKKQHQKRKKVYDNVIPIYKELGTSLLHHTSTIPALPHLIIEATNNALPAIDRMFALIPATKLTNCIISTPIAPCLIPFVLARACENLKRLPLMEAQEQKRLLKEKFKLFAHLVNSNLQEWALFPSLNSVVREQKRLMCVVAKELKETSVFTQPTESEGPLATASSLLPLTDSSDVKGIDEVGKVTLL